MKLKLSLIFLFFSSVLFAQKPNIIFLLTDDQRDNTFSCDGHPYVKTPNFDKLIGNGVRFTNTYIATPVCSPSRVSLFTGMCERKHAVGFSSSYKLTDKQWEKSYPALLRNDGYFTGFIGKIGIEYYTFKDRVEEKFDFWRGHNGWARFFPKTADNCKEYFDSDEDIITPIMGESMERFLDSVPDDKPFCLSVSFSVPHGSQTTSMFPENEEAGIMLVAANENPRLKGSPFYDKLYRNLTIEIPEETATDPYRFIPEAIMDQYQGRANETYIYNYNAISCTEHHIRYFQQITGLDYIVGELFKSLEKRGFAENTVIIFGSDHGLLMGEYGMGGKGLLYDLTTKIPCFVYDPRLPEPMRGRKINELVSSLDITTTILDYAGIEAPENMDGKSLKPFVYNENPKWRDELFLESLFTLRDNPFCEGIRSGNWKYIRMYDGIVHFDEADLDFKGRKPDFEQLFNLKQDPEEMVNLIDEYEGSKILTQLRRKCEKQSEEMNKKREKYMNTIDYERR
ncbi:sulfatase-like hydrolase/transferase [uncultured Draconibacterium sp.]|uniref:sulfatase-like hydrolase/transferase n=1 Tax=uncultured Draconibacterium sp. TaxID=1573823 RepID=UPI002AA8F5F7|nr:sulfatase-like hydrolase/transferase [uncultured Draconibacterium sp.]